MCDHVSLIRYVDGRHFLIIEPTSSVRSTSHQLSVSTYGHGISRRPLMTLHSIETVALWFSFAITSNVVSPNTRYSITRTVPTLFGIGQDSSVSCRFCQSLPFHTSHLKTNTTGMFNTLVILRQMLDEIIPSVMRYLIKLIPHTETTCGKQISGLKRLSIYIACSFFLFLFVVIHPQGFSNWTFIVFEYTHFHCWTNCISSASPYV